MKSLNAIADPTRRRIVEILAERDRSAGEIAAEFAMSAPAISQHLKVLRESGWVKVRVAGQQRIQSLDPSGLREMENWLVNTKRFWEGRLDALERELRTDDVRTATKTTRRKTK